MYVRVLLSRYRTALTCPTCSGTRLRAEALRFRLAGKTIAEAAALPVAAAREFLGRVAQQPPRAGATPPWSRRARASSAGASRPSSRRASATSSSIALADAVGRRARARPPRRLARRLALGGALRPRRAVGRASTPATPGEARRAPPRAGPRRETRSSSSSTTPADLAADHAIEIGPGAGSAGGELVFQGTIAELVREQDVTASVPLGPRKRRASGGPPGGVRARMPGPPSRRGRPRPDARGRRRELSPRSADGHVRRLGQREVDARRGGARALVCAR